MTEPKIKVRGLTLSFNEARDLENDTITAVLRPAKGVDTIHDGQAYFIGPRWHHPDDRGYPVDCPLATAGGVIFGQECWTTKFNEVLYRADASVVDRDKLRWRSSASMPRSAARSIRLVTYIIPVDFKMLTAEQLSRCGGNPKDPVVTFNTMSYKYCWFIALER